MRTEFTQEEKNILAPAHPGDFGIPKAYWDAAKYYAELTLVQRSAAIYTKGKVDGRREAMSDIRELLGITENLEM